MFFFCKVLVAQQFYFVVWFYARLLRRPWVSNACPVTRCLCWRPCCSSFSAFVNDINDIVKIGWLPVRQRRDFHVLKLVHQALYSPSWPSYVPLDTVKHLRSLRSGAATRLIIPMERGTFQDSAAKLFNVLPANIRNCSDFKVYCREVNAYLLNNICK